MTTTKCLLMAIMHIGNADGDYTYRDTQPDNADTIGRIENKWSSDIQHFAHIYLQEGQHLLCVYVEGSRTYKRQNNLPILKCFAL